MAETSWQPVMGAAQRRRERRLRSWCRHEQQTFRMALAAYSRHSAPRRPTMARAGEWERAVLHGHVPEHPTPQVAGTEYFSLDVEDVPAAGSRPDRQERVLRRTVKQIVDCVPVVPLFHTSEPQMVDSVVDVLQILDHSLPVGKAGKATRVPWLFMRHALRAPPFLSRRWWNSCGGTIGGGARPRFLWQMASTTVAFVDGTCEVGVAVPTGGWSAPTTPGGTAQLGSPPAQGGIQTLCNFTFLGLTSL